MSTHRTVQCTHRIRTRTHNVVRKTHDDGKVVDFTGLAPVETAAVNSALHKQVGGAEGVEAFQEPPRFSGGHRRLSSA